MTTPPIQPYEQMPAGNPAPMGLLEPRPTPRKPGIVLPYCMLPMAWVTYIILQLVVFVILLVAGGPSLSGTDPVAMQNAIIDFISQPRVFFTLALLSFIPLPALPMLLSIKTPEGFGKRLAFTKPRAGLPSILLLALGAFGAGVIISWLTELIGWTSEDVELLNHAFAKGNTGDFILAMLGIGIIGPFAEELIFRGFIQTRLVARHGPLLGIFITSALFAIWHIYPAHVVQVFPIGLMFGFAAWKTDSIWTGVFAHMLNNSIAVIAGFFLKDEELVRVLTWVMLGVSVLTVTGAILLLAKMKRPDAEMRGFPIS